MEQVDTDLGYTWDRSLYRSHQQPDRRQLGIYSSQLESQLDPELMIAIAAFLLLVIFTGYLITITFSRSLLQEIMASTAEDAIVDGIGENIIVTKNSSIDTTKNLIISAHYDSAEDSVGANDNGSGVAAVLELARILKDTEIPYNIKFILFSGEEKYMLGSRWYVGKLTEDERKQIIGVINIDTIAEKSDLGYMAMIEGNKRPDNAEYDDEGLKKLAELNKNSMSELFTPSDRFFLTMATNSDHYPFALVNIPAVSIVQDWQDGLNVNDSSDVKENMDIQRIVEVIDQVMEVLPTIN